MVKAILFDFWGTLVDNGVASPIKQVKDILGIRMPFSAYVVRMEGAMMTRKFDTLRNAFDAVAKEFRMRYSDEQMEELIGIWNKSWMLAQRYEELATILEQLQKKYTLVLVANTDNFSVPGVIEKLGWSRFFAQQFFSYELGELKTDADFLYRVLDTLKLKVEDCVMVGDSIHSDMMAAKQIGMKAILMDRKNMRDFEQKITNLSELEGVLV